MTNPSLKTTFNTVASLYEEVRPEYPEELIRDVIELSGIPRGGRMLEVGCGTGKATIPFATRGYQMTCIDIGSEMIKVAQSKLGSSKNVSFMVCPFEDWNSPQDFDLVISATAFRWVDAKVRHLRAAEALKPQGALAVFSYVHVRTDEGFFAEVQKIYDKYYVLPDGQEGSSTTVPSPEPGLDAFSDPVDRDYEWVETYTSERYLKLLGTYSGHIALPEESRRQLFNGIAEMIDSSYGGSVTKHYQAFLQLRKKKP